MRLIDADKMKEYMKVFTNKELMENEEVFEIIDEQPTTNCDKTQWISVKDKLPNNNERIIVIDEYSDIHRAKFEGGCWRELYTWFDIPNVELWMPEPELPGEH